MALRRLLLVVLLLTAITARAQVCPAEGNGLRRTLPVNVLDQDGNLVRDLTAADFRASFQGRPLKLVSAQSDSNARRILILLDMNHRMTGERSKWELAREAVQRMISEIPPEDSLALVLYGSRVVHKVEFAQGRDAVLNALAALGPDSHAIEGYRMTELFDGALDALPLFHGARPGDAIYAVTDTGFNPIYLATEGGEPVSKSQFEQVEKALVGSGVRLFVFFVDYPWRELQLRGASPGNVGGSGRSSTRAAEVLKRRPWEIEPGAFGRLAQASGGRTLTVYVDMASSGDPPWWRPWVKEQQAAAFDFGLQLFRRQMGEVYLLELELPVEPKESVDWKLEVLGADGKRRKDLTVVYPQKLVPCQAGKP